MKKSTKEFVRALPGPSSYCTCTTLCSPLEIEHVVPNALLKKCFNFKKATNDPHNLYTCCSKMNRQKSSKVFGKDFVLDNEQSFHTGALARACLHMLDMYNFSIDKHTVMVWKELHKNHYPHDFEFERDDLIFKHYSQGNVFLEDFLMEVDDDNIFKKIT